MNKNTKIEIVYFKEPIDIRTHSETRPERRVVSARYKLEMIGANWLLVTAPRGQRTWVPVVNIKSLVEATNEQ